ncbi:NAC domain-containing protein [Polychytrium aggregatum]|uniref:NAC domain-containing protein n=1 Tax=Polychytrium aggregatum TaxID=110093 RepID=UPI0022FE85D6|nr:NAC domain-containing protein [Polychytrium aggregatum]KAI9209792.1 NAC domain-containing protein [Polychytrium aggregatum]
MTKDDLEVQEQHIEESESDDELPELEGKNISRSEAKARKAMAKLGLKPITDISRVVIKRSRNIIFTIARPDVYKSVGDVYIVFGESKAQDISAQQDAANKQFQASDLAADMESSEEVVPAAPEAEADDDEAVDEEGVEDKDIELVMQQAGVSRAKAVKALKNNGNDIVNAIMELTM